MWPGASTVAVPLRQSTAAALHFPPQPLRPDSGTQEAASTGKKEPGHHAAAHPAPHGHRGRPLNSASTLRAPLTSPGTASRPLALQGSRARPRPPPHWAPRPSPHRARGVREAAPGPPVRAPGLGGESPLPPSARSAVPGLGCSSAAHSGPPWRRACDPGGPPQRVRGYGQKAASRPGAVVLPRVPEPGPNARARPAARNHGSRRLGAQSPSAPRCQGGGGGPGRGLAPAHPLLRSRGARGRGAQGQWVPATECPCPARAGGAAGRVRAGGERPGRRARGDAHAGLRGEARGPGGESAARAARPARARRPRAGGAEGEPGRGGARSSPAAGTASLVFRARRQP